MIRSYLFLPLLILVFCRCERYPKDVENTLDEVSNNTLKVGVTENPPYITLSDSIPSGYEVDLIKAIADDLNADIHWVQGSETTIIELLKQGQVHIAAGGLDKKGVWKKHVYLTHPHDTVIYTWGGLAGEEIPDDLFNKKIFAAKGSIAGAFAKKKNAEVVIVDSLKWEEPLIVAPKRELIKNGYQTSGKKLKEVHISLGITKGENAFVERVENIMKQYEGKYKEKNISF